MEKILASILIGLCIFLGNISSQAKSYKIVEHISSEHSIAKKAHSHHHHHGHHKHHHDQKNSKAHDHNHAVELSLATVYLALPSYTGFISLAPLSSKTLTRFYSLEVLNQLSFSPPVFRPPIA